MKRKRMTVYEFKGYLSERKLLRVYYDSELQDRYDPASPSNIKLSFPEIAIDENPDTIYLIGCESNIVILPNPDFIILENKTYCDMPMVRIVSCKYVGAETHDIVLVLFFA